ncbi:MAG: hypothetical protein PHW62_07280, partial [Candidatus Ratteibacteria bacterium]|nr:hypothetical protein [Candidatus Ratteibacteria bacterium]
MKKAKILIGMFAVSLMMIFLVGINNFCFAEGVEIWGVDGWTTTLSDGVPIDADTGFDAYLPQIAVAPNGMVYAVFCQRDDLFIRVYLSRYDGDKVEIWGNGGWTTTFTDGVPIDAGTDTTFSPQIAIDSCGRVYITYMQDDGDDTYHIYLNRYTGKNGVQIWGDLGEEETGWTTDLEFGIPIDPGTGDCVAPQLTVDLNNDNVYVTYTHEEVNSVYLNRYDGTDVRIWDNDDGWIAPGVANGDPIDTGT